jgi:membrane-associated phospholipid phosphatase
MGPLSALLRKQAPFLIPFLLFIVSGSIINYLYAKGELHLLFNPYHTAFFDSFFSIFTWAGDGFFALGVCIILAFVRWRHFLLFAASNIIASVIVQVMKNFVFPDDPRPAAYFVEPGTLYLIPGLDNNYLNSFPSGHTVIGFATFFSFSLILETPWKKTLMFVAALMIGYSRIYLQQHFFNDVYAASIIGVFTAAVVYLVIENYRLKRSPAWLEKSLLIR